MSRLQWLRSKLLNRFVKTQECVYSIFASEKALQFKKTVSVGLSMSFKTAVALEWGISLLASFSPLGRSVMTTKYLISGVVGAYSAYQNFYTRSFSPYETERELDTEYDKIQNIYHKLLLKERGLLQSLGYGNLSQEARDVKKFLSPSTLLSPCFFDYIKASIGALLYSYAYFYSLISYAPFVGKDAFIKEFCLEMMIMLNTALACHSIATQSASETHIASLEKKIDAIRQKIGSQQSIIKNAAYAVNLKKDGVTRIIVDEGETKISAKDSSIKGFKEYMIFFLEGAVPAQGVLQILSHLSNRLHFVPLLVWGLSSREAYQHARNTDIFQERFKILKTKMVTVHHLMQLMQYAFALEENAPLSLFSLKERICEEQDEADDLLLQPLANISPSASELRAPNVKFFKPLPVIKGNTDTHSPLEKITLE